MKSRVSSFAKLILNSPKLRHLDINAFCRVKLGYADELLNFAMDESIVKAGLV